MNAKRPSLNLECLSFDKNSLEKKAFKSLWRPLKLTSGETFLFQNLVLYMRYHNIFCYFKALFLIYPYGQQSHFGRHFLLFQLNSNLNYFWISSCDWLTQLSDNSTQQQHFSVRLRKNRVLNKQIRIEEIVTSIRNTVILWQSC